MTMALDKFETRTITTGERAHVADAPIPLPIRAHNLQKSIDERPILKNLSFQIPQGQFIALLGANGAGKSTLLKLLATLTTPSHGTLELFGHPANTSATTIRAKIGLIGHQSMLYHDLSALENLEFFGKLYGTPNPRQRALQLLNQLGLAHRANDPVKSFSRGMAQRVSIARALLHDPDLLLADEPFAGLDAPSADLLETLLTQLHQQGKTILLANHDIRQSLRLAQRALVLSQGTLALDAPTNTLTPDQILSHMNGAPAPAPTQLPISNYQLQPAPAATTPRHPNHSKATFLTLTKKDLKIEGRTRQTLGLVLVLGILIVSVLGLGIGSNPALASLGTPALLWVAYLFSGVLCFEKTMAVERQDGALAGLLLAPIDRSAIYFGKLLSNLLLMCAVAGVITAVGILFFSFDLSPAPFGFIAIIAISMLGFAAVGTLFSALVASTRLQGGLLAMVIFPLILPLVIASTSQITAMFRDNQNPGGTGLAILLAFDAIFLITSWLIFELVLEP